MHFALHDYQRNLVTCGPVVRLYVMMAIPQLPHATQLEVAMTMKLAIPLIVVIAIHCVVETSFFGTHCFFCVGSLVCCNKSVHHFSVCLDMHCLYQIFYV